MRLRYTLAIVLLISVVGVGSALANTAFTANINGANEAPPNASTATGMGVFILSDNQTLLSWTISHNVVNESAAHIHVGDVGVSGPVVLNLGVGSPKIGNAPMPGVQSVNVTCDGIQEVPANGSTATGLGALSFNANPTNLAYNITHNVLNESAAHFHNAPVGVGGGVVFNLGVGSPKIGNWAAPVNMVRELFRDRIYINIHSTAFPGGEIRGNVIFPASFLKDLFAGLLYVNIHTTAFPAGEIRGQILFNDPPVPTQKASWGRLKSLYR